jgi:ribosomal protein S18 acetylase RimI-like enzyme
VEKNSLIFKIKTASEGELIVHLKECDKHFIPYLSERVNIRDYAGKLAEKSITFEAWNKKELVGLIATYLNEETCSGFITNVSVFDEYRGTETANSLLNMCKDYLLIHGCKEINLEVNKNNIAAIRFYKKNGFVEAETKGDLLAMCINLKL